MNHKIASQHPRQPAILSIGLSLALVVAAAATGCDSGPAESPCPPDEDYFVKNVWTPILSVSCIACHNPDGVAKSTRFVLRPPDQPNFLDANLQIVSDVARLEHDGTSVLLLRPSGRHPEGHSGGTVVEAESAQYHALAEFVGRVVGEPDACAAAAAACQSGDPGPQTLRRLTRDEFDNTIEDLFGFPSTWGAAFASDTVVNGYDNNAAALTVSPLLADQVRTAAEDIAAQALPGLDALSPCPIADGRECAATFMTRFGERVFRRPLTEDEVTRYLDVYDVGAEEGPAAGFELLITAMLQSPHFLYRSELGEDTGDGTFALNDFEIASELSYLVWGSMPDDQLLDAARAGALRDPAMLEAQALRLLASPRSQAMFERFTAQWLAVGQVGVVPKDGALYPEFTPDIRAAMAQEATRLVAEVTRAGGGFADLLAADFSMINSALAGFYGVSEPSNPDAAGFGRVDLSDGSRGGLLTLGAVLATHARPNDSSPVHRGRFVRERLLCQHLPPPPPGINAEPPGLDPSLTTRERYRQHSEDPACAGCHRLMDPIGFGFERYDGIGRLRADENGLAIDEAGEIIDPDGGSVAFTGAGGLADELSVNTDAQACFTLQWVRYAYGVEENPALRCVIDDVEQAFAASDGRVEDLIRELVRSPHFTRRMVPRSAPDNGPGNGPGNDPGNGPVGTPGGDTPDGLLSIDERTDSQWGTGSCHSVTVKNDSDSDVDWQVTITVAGTINDHWNANLTQDGDRATFSGLSWNDILSPGGTADFGFCVQF